LKSPINKRKIFGLIIGILVILFVFSFYSFQKISNPKEKEKARAESITLVNPYKNYANNYKGNLHAHSTNSDGADSPAVVGEWYRDHGYKFYAITDHNYLTPDPGVSGIVWMGKSEEGSLSGNTAHMGIININTVIPSSTAQTMITNALGQGGQTILHHPDRADKRWTAETVEGLSGTMGFEIYNGSGLNSTGTWDTILTSGKNIWGDAGDDSHNIAGKGTAYVVVNSDKVSPTANDILSEMVNGNFYASRGLDLTITVVGDTISASTTNGNKIRWIKYSGGIIKTTNANSDNYTANGSEYYIRVEVLDGSDNPKAWSQPIYVSGASPPSPPPPPPPPPPAVSPVYRFYNKTNGTHFYTASEAEKNNIIARWPNIYKFEGFAYNVSSLPTSAIVYRFWNNNGTHFYTVSEAEKNNIIARWGNTFKFEGLAYYVSPYPTNNTVYRFYNMRNNTHFFTASASERDNIMAKWGYIYRYEGIAWFLP